MALSFLIATSLYLTMAYVVQHADLHGNYRAPFSAILGGRFGRAGEGIVCITAVVLIYANLSSALWAVSRMIYSLAKEGILPRKFSSLTHGQPIIALATLAAVSCFVICMDWLKWLDISTSLRLSGQNLFLLYGLGALALFKLSHRLVERLISAVALFIIFCVAIFQGGSLLYPILICIFAWCIHVRKNACERS
jgi:amino acid efflux transporter